MSKPIIKSINQLTHNPSAALLIIGDEILSGRTLDINSHYLAKQLRKNGIDLREVRVIADDLSAIIAAVRALSVRFTMVFTSGGIGPTHDDITADAIAAAFKVRLDINDKARALLAKHYQLNVEQLSAARLRMTRIPYRARLIKNTISAAPGFCIENVYVMAGVPRIFAAMVDWILPSLVAGSVVTSQSVQVFLAESVVAPQLGLIAQRFSDVTIGSYPFERGGNYGTDLVVSGINAQRVKETIDYLRATFKV